MNIPYTFQFFLNIIIASIIFTFLISAIKLIFINKTLNIKWWIAFIPIYNLYRILKEYKGRVFRRNWGVLLVANALVIITLLTTITIIAISGYITSNNGLSVFVNIIFATIVFSIIGLVINFLALYPFLISRNLKIAFIVLFILTIINNILPEYLSLLIIVASIVLEFCLVNNIYKKVKSGEYGLVPKIDTQDKLELKEHIEKYERKIVYKKTK